MGIPEDLRSRPFTAAQAHTRGLSWKVLNGGRFRHLFHGVYASKELPNTLDLWLDAAALILPEDAVFSHRTAARMTGAPVPRDGQVHATIPGTRSRTSVAGVRLHRCRSVVPYILIGGRRCTPPERTFVDVAASLGLVDLVIVGDHLVRYEHATLDGLRTAVIAAKGARGVPLARRAAQLVRDRVDSPMETRIRLLLVLAGLPCPKVNLDITRSDGRFVCTPDLHYRESKVIIEYDGDVHRVKTSKWRRDHTVRRMLMDLQWKIFPFNAADYFGAPGSIVWAIHQALLARGQPRTPAQTSDEWTLHIAQPRDELWAGEPENVPPDEAWEEGR